MLMLSTLLPAACSGPHCYPQPQASCVPFGPSLDSLCGHGVQCTVDGKPLVGILTATKGEVIDLMLGGVAPVLRSQLDDTGSSFELYISYVSKNNGAGTAPNPKFTDIQVFFDGKLAPGCKTLPGEVACPGVPTGVQNVRFSFSYDGGGGLVQVFISLGPQADAGPNEPWGSCEVCETN
jgi:hypothetical protein